jgi:hypothetical protein
MQMSIQRSITLLCLAQMLTIICGFSFLAMCMRGQGYPGEPMIFQISSFGTYHWSHLALFLRRAGLFLLVIPVIWMILTLLAEQRGRFGLPFGFWIFIGIILPCAFIMTYCYVSFHPCFVVPN